MQDYLQVLAFAALPAAGNFLGGVLAEIFRVSDRSLSLALYLAAGIVLAVVGIELMLQARKSLGWRGNMARITCGINPAPAAFLRKKALVIL